MPIDPAEQDRFQKVEAALATLRRANSQGDTKLGGLPTAKEVLAELDIAGLALNDRDFWQTFRTWLARRVEVIARELDPRLCEDCLELRRLAFFACYYLEPFASYTRISDLHRSSAMLFPNIDALLLWWERTTQISISSLPPLPQRTKPQVTAISDLLPVSSRTVGDNIRMATCRVFNIRVGRAPKTSQSAISPAEITEANPTNVCDHLQSVARLMARQWPVAKPYLVPAAELNEVVKQRRSLIVGSSGSGKTILLRRLASVLSERKEGLAVVVDLRERETWPHLGQPCALAARALSLPSTASDCERLLASGDMTLLLDHVEFLSEPALPRLVEAIKLIPKVFIAVPAWCTKHFSNLPRYDMPPPHCDILAAFANQEQADVLDDGLKSTPLGFSILSSLPRGDRVEAAQHALLKLIEHAQFGIPATNLMKKVQWLVISLALQGANPHQAFHPSEVLLRKISEENFRLLVLAGLLIPDANGYRFSYPDLAITSVQRDWLPLMLKFVSGDSAATVVSAAKLIAVDEDTFARVFLPELVGAVEHGLLLPNLVIDAILNLSEQTISCHTDYLRAFIARIDESWQRNMPDDSDRQQSIRNAIFMLKRHELPGIERPIQEMTGEIASLLAGADGKLDREQLWAAVCLADAASVKDVAGLSLVVDFFDMHPECQADLLIGCLKADTTSGFDIYVSLLQRATFCAASSAGYVAAAFPDWKDQFSLSLLHAYVQDSNLQPDSVAHCFAHAVWTHLTPATV